METEKQSYWETKMLFLNNSEHMQFDFYHEAITKNQKKAE